MIITWLLAMTTLALIFLVTTGVLAALSINSTNNGNRESARTFAISAAAVGILGGLIFLILFFYYIISVSPKSGGVIGIAILALFFLFGAGTLAVFATTSATTPVGDFALWAAIISFGGALALLVIAIFYLYINWFEIASEIYLELAGSLESFRRQQTIQERKIPVFVPREPLVRTTAVTTGVEVAKPAKVAAVAAPGGRVEPVSRATQQAVEKYVAARPTGIVAPKPGEITYEQLAAQLRS